MFIWFLVLVFMIILTNKDERPNCASDFNLWQFHDGGGDDDDDDDDDKDYKDSWEVFWVSHVPATVPNILCGVLRLTTQWPYTMM